MEFARINKDKIIKLASDVGGLQHNWTSRVLRHAVSEFSKKGLTTVLP